MVLFWQIPVILAVVLADGLVIGEILTPPYFNLAERKRITATATCGVDTEGPELYCKLVGANAENDNDVNLIQGQYCDVCDPTRKDKMHPPEFAIDGRETWWQSPPLSRGMKYNEVNLTIDLGQEFHVAYVYIRMGNSPRPGLWVLEKSADYGQSYTPWQYFSDSPADCERFFGRESLRQITKDDSVICSTEFSKIVPLEGGEIPISLLNNRPSSNHYFNSSVLQEWTRATNVRIRLLRTKTLLGHLMSVSRQDPTVTRRYFYSIKDISIGGRCMCNGHADTCYSKNDTEILICQCRHNTCGDKCERCCPGFEQKAWRQSKSYSPFECEPCNCFSHSNECVYDPEIDRKRLSLDIHGRYEGGGVCRNCQHNTEGINCNKCKDRFYKPHNKHWNETDVCQPCNCNYHYSTGNCEQGSGRCECRKEFQPPLCDSCSFGHYGYPDCKECDCFLNGTNNFQCEPVDGRCNCLDNFGGKTCRTCADGYYDFPKCEACLCDAQGSASFKCNQISGNCTCKANYGGKYCDRCKDGFYNYPTCEYCNCDVKGTKDEICDKSSGKCICKEGYGGELCDQCSQGYYGYPDCKPCNCSTIGSQSTNCDINGKCHCLGNFGGRTCDSCSPGYYKYPECQPCKCDPQGSRGLSCDETGKCDCEHNFDAEKCDKCKDGFYNFPACEGCNCHPAGVVAGFEGCGSVPAGELCKCKDRVEGRICNKCKELYWNLNLYNVDGCEDCDCNAAGVLGGVSVCDSENGQCVCKPSVVARGCTECEDGTFDLRKENLFGCTDCGCDVGGSVKTVCDKLSGQCLCQSRVTGRTCREPIATHYFPTLFQYQYEIENGRTPENTVVRYLHNETVFPDYSWRGYAEFTTPQTEVLQDIFISKPSLYRMVLRYVNPNAETVVGSIKVIPDNPTENEQVNAVQFKPSHRPAFVTVSGDAAGNAPTAFIMNPGRWTISVQADRNVLLDYFVLIPEDFYLATILRQKVESPCKVNERGLCRQFTYPITADYDAEWGAEHTGVLGPGYQNEHHLSRMTTKCPYTIPILGANGADLIYNMTVSKPGQYVLLVEYLTPLDDDRSFTVDVTGTTSTTGDFPSMGRIEFYNCHYTTFCRQIVTNALGGPTIYRVGDDRALSVKLNGSGADVGIVSLVAVPIDEWSYDFVQPRSVCIKKGDNCVTSAYVTPSDSKKYRFEHEGVTTTDNKTSVVVANATYVRLHRNDTSVRISAKVQEAGYYVLVLHYHQPSYTETLVHANVMNHTNGSFVAHHCPSISGCRTAFVNEDGGPQLYFYNNFTLTLTIPKEKELFLDYLMVVPHDLYDSRVLQELDLNRASEFITTCGNNHFYIDTTIDGFCKDSVFSITAGYNNGALPCQCDYEGSLSFECDKFGGQCNCKPNVIGRTCEACKTGYYGFPDCRPCNCSQAAFCEANTGQCICPKFVVGDDCDRCMPNTYNYDRMFGCEECNCDPLGIERSLQCDLITGNCSCKPHIVGRNCSACEDGHFSFPYCERCECDLAGTTARICDKNTAECFCKKNSIGPACNMCRPGTFNLQEADEDGCTQCFCFGKTSRCESSGLVRTRIFDMSNWRLVKLDDATNAQFNIVDLNVTLHAVNDVTVGADLTPHALDDEHSVYFAAPPTYLGKLLTAYGGLLNYSVFYTSGPSGRAIRGADVVLEGADGTYLMHYSAEQPAAAVEFFAAVQLSDFNFELADGAPAKREHLMQVLKDLRGLYVRASYWTDSITTRLATVLMDDAMPYRHNDDLDIDEIEFADSVERCTCPENYQGLSCEECAPGFYRSAGPHGGYCVPCECNGHATECDVNTGKCSNCMHNTRGDHCELCDVGYHGNALQGTPMDCLICACPLPVASNNFATGCQVNAEGDKISCDCRPGYIGGRCQSCGPGSYGKPDMFGDYCKPCQCSGNIDPLNPGSCDTVTGECLECLNNTFGNVCQFCKPGFYGDAVRLKNCQACICDETGTDHCDRETGVCVCKPNVIGEKCDRCMVEHYGFQSGRGCVACDCGEASYSGQCADADGQCRCKPGVTGRMCERCAAGYWNYTANGCISCECRSEYSSGYSCDERTGQCKCLKNVSGEKCEHCPHRWVFIEDYGCEPCDNCVHSLLDTTDRLQRLIDPVIDEYARADSGYFTTRRLVHINDTIKRLNPRLDRLDSNMINLTPIFDELETLEQSSKNMYRKSNYSLDNSKVISASSDKLREEAVRLLDEISLAEENVEMAIKDIEDLTLNITEGEGTKIDAAVQEATRLLDEIRSRNLTEQETEAEKSLARTRELLDAVREFKTPIDDLLDEIDAADDDNVVLDEKLDDLLNHTNYARNKADEADELYERNGKERVEKLLSNIKNHTQEADKNFNDTITLLSNASKYLTDTKNLLVQLKIEPFQLRSFVNEVNATFEERDDGIVEIEELKPQLKEHAENLSQRAGELHGLLSATKDTSENAIKAANAYKDIANAIREAQAAAESSKEYVDEAAISFGKLQENATDAESNSSSALDDAFDALQNVTELEPVIVDAVTKSRPIRALNEANKENLDAIDTVLKQLQAIDPYMDSLNEAVKLAEHADDHTAETKISLQNNFKEISNETESAKEVPKKLDDTNRFIVQIEKQMSHVNEKLPVLVEMVKEFPDASERVEAAARNIDDEIKKLNEQIALARDLADRIRVGLKFRKDTTLELRNPPNLQDLSTATYVSGYFRTASPYGLLLYLGNGNGTNLKRTKTDDYMALEIENGYPALTLDIGNGPQRILNEKYVATNEWYQFIIDRVGMNVKLIIKEELPDHIEKATVTEETLNGHYSIFNLDRNQSKLFLGSYPLEFNMQDTVRTNSFEGEVEDLVIGDRPVSLWNFNHGQNNNEGAKERTKFVNLRPSTGYRFNGNGYAVLNARSFNLRARSDIQLKFKTFASDGLLFLIGKDGTFISVEIRNGRVVYQYNLGSGTKTWHTTRTYNDGLWHKVVASREGAKGRFAVDSEEVRDVSRPIHGNAIAASDTMVFGGYPQSHEYGREITNVDFDGCIDEVYISSRPVDLSENVKAYGVTPGCPIKLTRLVSFEAGRPGYINRGNVSVANDFKINLKFKTREKDGIIFYVTDRMQNAGISLCLLDGRLKLISQKIELVSDENSFNDSEWHVVSVRHDAKILRFDFDDHGFKATDSPPNLHLLYGNMYIGGVPPNYGDRTGSLGTRKAFAGCIGDATLGGVVIDFSNSTEKRNEILGKCVLDKSIGSDSDIHTVPELPPIDAIDEVTETDLEGVTVDSREAEIPKRGDGGDDRGGPLTDDKVDPHAALFTEAPDDIDEATEFEPHVPTTVRPPPSVHQPPVSPFAPLPFDSCALPLEPAKNNLQQGSYRFGASGRSRLEYYFARGKFRKNFDFAFQFRTTAEEGVLFYASDQIHSQFVGVFLKNAHVVYVFDGRHGLLRLRSNAMYNDDRWHTVIFSRQGADGKLVVDEEVVDFGRTSGNTVKVEMNTPFYLGGFNPEFDANVSAALNTTAQYVGCIRNFSMNGKQMESPKEYDVMPCSENVELGVFFGRDGGFVKLEERYNVGLEIVINMDIKPRTTSGLLISAHGKHHYLILELLDGTLKFTMYNGKQPITTSYVPKTKYYFCDGNWHHIQAVKSKSVVSLSVDKVSPEPGVGDIHRVNTYTTGSLFLGGHRLLAKIRGLESRKPFVGCIKNVVIKEKTYVINRDMISGAVTLGSCPTN